VERFSSVLSKEPGHFDVLVRRGQTRWLRGNVDGAFEDFRLAVSVNPFEPELELWLGLTQLKRGERADGLAQIQLALDRVSAGTRRGALYRAAQMVALWEMGQEERVAQQALSVSQMSSTPLPSWMWDFYLKDVSVPRPPVVALYSAARARVARRPEPRVETDGPTGISLEWWEPISLTQRLDEVEAALKPHSSSEPKTPIKTGK
jgi:hypothetical protein